MVKLVKLFTGSGVLDVTTEGRKKGKIWVRGKKEELDNLEREGGSEKEEGSRAANGK